MRGLFSCLRNSKPGKFKLCRPATAAYASAWGQIHNFPEFKRASPKDKLSFIEFAIRAIERDLQHNFTAAFLYEKQNPTRISGVFPIPLAFPEKESVPEEDISLEGKTAIVLPFDQKRIPQSIKDIGARGYHRLQTDVTGQYFPEINLVLIINGRHHAAVDLVKNGEQSSVTVRTEVYRLADAFTRLKLSPDRQLWICDDEQLPVTDARFALLYELAKEANELRHSLA